MREILVATGCGCLTFAENGNRQIAFENKMVNALTLLPDQTVLAVVNGNEFWIRDLSGTWVHQQTLNASLSALSLCGNDIIAATSEPALISIDPSGIVERLDGFDKIEGRAEWFAQGPPIHVRSVTTSADSKAILVAVHVGGIPRSTDGGKTWTPTIAIMDDVHEVRAHPSRAEVAAAVTAYGLILSKDAGQSWTLLADGPEVTHGLALTILPDQILFSVQEDPFAKRSQIWRHRFEGGAVIEQVRDGLPEWLEGKVDTSQMTSSNNCAAFVDGSGKLWFSPNDASNWKPIASDLPYTLSMVIV
jgi:hypothetical protein